MKGVLLGLASMVLFASCAGSEEPAHGLGFGLRDPLDLIDDVEGDLRLLVFSAETHSCDAAMGLLTPEPNPERGAEVADAVVDITFSPSTPTTMVQLNPGTYSVLVRGWGTDVVSGVPNTIIASGCAGGVEIAAGETREINIDLIQIFGEGVCGDGILSPDEQCDDNNTTSGDGCSDTCRTEPFQVARPASGAAGEQLPAAAWTPGQRAAVVYDSNDASREVKIMLFGPDGQPITTPTALGFDGPADTIAGVQTSPTVSMGGGRIATAWADFRGGADPSDVYVRFFDMDRNPQGATALATDASTSAQAAPSIATRSDGSTLVAFEDATSATGLSGAFFAAGATTPAGADFAIGEGTTGATAPAAVALPDGFLVAFTASGDVFLQRFDATGSPVDASAQPVLDDAGGTQDQPATASLPDGRTVVAWRDSTGDGAGTAIRARVFGADGVAVGPAVVVNSTTGGDQSAPAAAAGAERFAVAFQSGSEIRCTMLNADGVPALNREADPSPGDFPVASGAVSEVAAAAGGPAAEPLLFIVWKDTAMDAVGDIRGRLFPLP